MMKKKVMFSRTFFKKGQHRHRKNKKIEEHLDLIFLPIFKSQFVQLAISTFFC
jgi:hypothetical protein